MNKQDIKKEIVKKVTFKVFDKETNSYVEEWQFLGFGINKNGVLSTPTYEKNLSPVSEQFEYHIQEELYTKREVEDLLKEEREKTFEEMKKELKQIINWMYESDQFGWDGKEDMDDKLNEMLSKLVSEDK